MTSPTTMSCRASATACPSRASTRGTSAATCRCRTPAAAAAIYLSIISVVAAGAAVRDATWQQSTLHLAAAPCQHAGGRCCPGCSTRVQSKVRGRECGRSDLRQDWTPHLRRDGRFGTNGPVVDLCRSCAWRGAAHPSQSISSSRDSRSTGGLMCGGLCPASRAPAPLLPLEYRQRKLRRRRYDAHPVDPSVDAAACPPFPAPQL
jgi:hypothetical protein